MQRDPRGEIARRPAPGFTLIELVIVVLVIAILTAIAYPSYVKYVARTNRKAAEACLSEYANYMERYYTTNLRYDRDSASAPNTLPALDCVSAGQTGTKYTYSFQGALTANTYAVRAVPIGVQQTNDAQCGTLALDQAGTRTASGSSGAAQCW
jgi:type IV pilus assembly protein PilE